MMKNNKSVLRFHPPRPTASPVRPPRRGGDWLRNAPSPPRLLVDWLLGKWLNWLRNALSPPRRGGHRRWTGWVKPIFILVCILALTTACKKPQNIYTVAVKEMTDAQYPDNPNLESRHSAAQQKLFKNVVVSQRENDLFDLDLYSHQDSLCHISLKNIPVLEMMPTAPEWIKSDDYLTYIGIINQEWNRQQVQFRPEQFTVSGKLDIKITRVDLARNCLNAYLWEMLIYAQDSDGKDKLYWQCWFDFPEELYAQLFEKRNNLPYEIFRKGLENWIDPESKLIDLNKLRKANGDGEAQFEAKNNEMYPLKGERERKRKNIVYPKKVEKINDLLTDSTTFATFSVPGYYNTKDPRKTELSRLGTLQKVVKRQIINALGKPAQELELIFVSNKDQKTITKLVIGGLEVSLIPALAEANANDGWQTSMGISNHSFYETFDFQQAHLTKNNGFYAFLLDDQNRWIDSHKVGIDGPLLHFAERDKSKLHLWILAFERHAFVGHYVIQL